MTTKHLSSLVKQLSALGPVLVLERYNKGELKRVGLHKKIITKGDMLGVLSGDPTRGEIHIAEKLLGDKFYKEDQGLWFGVRRDGTRVELAI